MSWLFVYFLFFFLPVLEATDALCVGQQAAWWMKYFCICRYELCGLYGISTRCDQVDRWWYRWMESFNDSEIAKVPDRQRTSKFVDKQSIASLSWCGLQYKLIRYPATRSHQPVWFFECTHNAMPPSTNTKPNQVSFAMTLRSTYHSPSTVNKNALELANGTVKESSEETSISPV